MIPGVLPSMAKLSFHYEYPSEFLRICANKIDANELTCPQKCYYVLSHAWKCVDDQVETRGDPVC